jgi:hypothetical protein
MSKNKVKDAGPDGHKKMVSFDGTEEDVEGHQRRLPREAGPEGTRRLPKYDGGDENDVEGHGKHLPK